MVDRDLPAGPAGGYTVGAGRAGRWLAAAMALAVLAGCEHGQVSFDRDTGQFRMPIGVGSKDTR